MKPQSLIEIICKKEQEQKNGRNLYHKRFIGYRLEQSITVIEFYLRTCPGTNPQNVN